MRLYSTRSDTAFTLLQAAHDESWTIRGGVPAERSELPPLSPVNGAAEEFIPVDCLTLMGGADGLVLSEFARGALEPVLSDAGEFIPVRVMEHPYWWFNCLAYVDALDRERTDADWGQVDGSWGSFRWIVSTRQLAFQLDALRSAPAIFRLPEYPQGTLLCSDVLVEAVSEQRLTGFRFDLVWSRLDGGVVDPPGFSMSGVFDDPDPAATEAARAEARDVLRARGA